MDIIARPALGIAIGAGIAAMASETAFAATVGLADADLLAVKVRGGLFRSLVSMSGRSDTKVLRGGSKIEKFGRAAQWHLTSW